MKPSSAFVVARAIVAFAATMACGASGAAGQAASGDCAAVGTKACPNDDEITQQDFDECTARKASPCSAPYVAALECVGNNIQCDSAGMTDTSNLNSQCGSQESAYDACVAQNPSTDGGL